MPRQRRHFTPEQKVALLRLHLLEHKPISDTCQEHNLSVNLFYLWQKQFFENGTAAFENNGKRYKVAQDAKDRTIAVAGGRAACGGGVCRALQHGAFAQRHRLCHAAGQARGQGQGDPG